MLIRRLDEVRHDLDRVLELLDELLVLLVAPALPEPDELTVKGGHLVHELVVEPAQLAGVVAQSDPTIPPLDGLKLTAIRGVKIVGTASPGQTIRLNATVLGRMNHLINAQGSASVNGATVMQCELTLSGEP